MAQVEKLFIFLASAGDVPNERRYVQEVVDELNQTVASARGIVLQVVSWENDAFPGYGMDAQALLNVQIAEMAKVLAFRRHYVESAWNAYPTCGIRNRRRIRARSGCFDTARTAQHLVLFSSSPSQTGY